MRGQVTNSGGFLSIVLHLHRLLPLNCRDFGFGVGQPLAFQVLRPAGVLSQDSWHESVPEQIVSVNPISSVSPAGPVCLMCLAWLASSLHKPPEGHRLKSSRER